MEWHERRGMRDEDQQLTKHYLERETADEQYRMEEDAKSSRGREIDKMWRAMMMEEGEEKKRAVAQLLEAAAIRGSKDKKKGKRGGKNRKKK